MRVSSLTVLASILGLTLAGCTEESPTGTALNPTSADLRSGAAAWHEHPGSGLMASGSPGVAGGFRVEPLARGYFPDGVDVQFRIKLDTRTTIASVEDPSDVLVARLTFEPGGSVGWHTHHGPVIVTIASGSLSVINASDCIHRVYQAGTAFIDPGQGNVHVGYNETDGETVVYATFLDVPVGQPATIPAGDPGCLT